MGFENNIEMLSLAFWQVLKLAGPVLAVALIIGLLIGIIQAATSINEMTYKYPLNYDELSMISGVGEGKSKKFGERIISIISKYCGENNIEREQDFLIKSTGSKSTLKLFIILLFTAQIKC